MTYANGLNVQADWNQTDETADDFIKNKPDGLWGINCHHVPPNCFIPGMSEVQGNDAMPSEEENRRRYALDQEKKKYEREARLYGREKKMLKAAGDEEGAKKAAEKEKRARERAKNVALIQDDMYNNDVAFASPIFVSKMDILYRNALNIKPLDGYQDIVCHADKYSIIFKDQNGVEDNISVDEFASILKESKFLNDKPIRLIACEAAAKGSVVAQSLADKLGMKVLAPDGLVFVYPDGKMRIVNFDSGTAKEGGWVGVEPKSKNRL